MSYGNNWSKSELAAAVGAYLEMLNCEKMSQSYSKTETNEALRLGPLSGRTNSSIEYRMQNISAVMAE